MNAMASQITSLIIVSSTVLVRRGSKKTSKFRVTGLCAGNLPVTGEFPTQRANNAETVFIWWKKKSNTSTDSSVQYHIEISHLRSHYPLVPERVVNSVTRHKSSFDFKLVRYWFLGKQNQFIVPDRSWCILIKSSWPNDANDNKTRLIFTQVIGCSLTIPSHYLNECWLISNGAAWHSP